MQPTLSAIPHGGGIPSLPAVACGFLFFQIGLEEFGIKVRQVHEIVSMKNITPLSGPVAHLEGTLALRGSVIPVVRLGTKLEQSNIGHTRHTCVLVIERQDDGRLIGVVVDRLLEVVSLAPSHWKWTSTASDRDGNAHFTGVTMISGRSRTLLDIDRVLSSQEWTGLDALLK